MGTGEHVHSIFLIRHGQTSYNSQHRWQGQIDIPLNDVGRWQVKQTAAELTRLYVHGSTDKTFDIQAGIGQETDSDGERIEYFGSHFSPAPSEPQSQSQSGPAAASLSASGPTSSLKLSERRQLVVASHLSRAQETAHIFADPLGIEVNTDERIAERSFGEWEGLSMDEIKSRFPEDYASWEHFGGGELKHGAEPKEHVGRRGMAALKDWAYKAGDNTDLFVFSHGAWINQTLQMLLRLTDAHPDFTSLVSMRNAFWVKLSALDLPDGSVRWRLEEYEHGPVAAYITNWNNPWEGSGQMSSYLDEK